MTPIFNLQMGHAPLLVSLPHVGITIADDIRHTMRLRALDVPDTDWHLDLLYAFVTKLGASLIVPQYSRYVIDLNRPPENTPMYAGSNNTELCPTRSFTGDAIYHDGQSPSSDEIARRCQRYWLPYHDALKVELARIRAVHGHAILFDGHSIKSTLPWLFEGQLPDLNLGTVNGSSCAPSLREALNQQFRTQTPYSYALDGRFKGGYITRQYGRPNEHIHAVQLEMSWRCYMAEAPPFEIDPARESELQPLLKAIVETMIEWKPT
jgi:N-formylglutamate deformylase